MLLKDASSITTNVFRSIIIAMTTVREKLANLSSNGGNLPRVRAGFSCSRSRLGGAQPDSEPLVRGSRALTSRPAASATPTGTSTTSRCTPPVVK